MIIKGKIFPLDRSNIDTDQIIPARHLTGITKSGYGVHLLEDVPGTTINDPKYKDRTILLSRENFGCSKKVLVEASDYISRSCLATN